LALYEKEFQDKIVFSPNHLLEIYLYQYYIGGEEFEVTDMKIHALYRQLADKFSKKDRVYEAIEIYEKSLAINPLDIETRSELAKLYRRTGKWDLLFKTAEEMYPFCYTISDLSRYYRILGEYYLETYKPEVSAAAYTYSNYFHPTETAGKEILFLEKALNKKFAFENIQELQNILMNENIPLNGKNETLGLLYKTGMLELDKNNTEYACCLLMFLYQLTKDEETGEILKQFNLI
jgi:tetratricopeptide (TPR) repeat protein